MGFARLERRWLVTVFDAILPDGAVAGLPGASRAPLDRFLEDFGAAAPTRMLWGVRLALWFVMFLAPFVTLRRPRTFLGLEGEDRLRVLRELRTSRWYVVRELPVLLKSIACLGHCGLPDVQKRIGMEAGGEPPSWAR
jgi:hypothetical protein